jgi:uncharacterized oligopeptide transporter (OPT) family protein
VAIGIYLPFELEVPIFIGGILHYCLRKHYKNKAMAENQAERAARKGLLFASGLITGEALVGIFLAIPIVIAGRPDVLAVVAEPIGAWPGVILLVGIAYWLYRVALGNQKA